MSGPRQHQRVVAARRAALRLLPAPVVAFLVSPLSEDVDLATGVVAVLAGVALALAPSALLRADAGRGWSWVAGACLAVTTAWTPTALSGTPTESGALVALVGSSWVLLTIALTRGGWTGWPSAGATAALLVAVAPGGAAALRKTNPLRQPVTVPAVVRAYLAPPGPEVASRYLDWHVAGERQRLFDAAVPDWRDRDCLGVAAACPLPDLRTLAEPVAVRSSCSAVRRRCAWIRSDRYDEPQRVGYTRSTEVDWVVETDLDGAFRSLHTELSPHPLPADGRGWLRLAVAVLFTFGSTWGALVLLGRQSRVVDMG